MQCAKECDLPFMKKLLSGMTIHKTKAIIGYNAKSTDNE